MLLFTTNMQSYWRIPNAPTDFNLIYQLRQSIKLIWTDLYIQKNLTKPITEYMHRYITGLASTTWIHVDAHLQDKTWKKIIQIHNAVLIISRFVCTGESPAYVVIYLIYSIYFFQVDVYTADRLLLHFRVQFYGLKINFKEINVKINF